MRRPIRRRRRAFRRATIDDDTRNAVYDELFNIQDACDALIIAFTGGRGQDVDPKQVIEEINSEVILPARAIIEFMEAD